MIDPAHIESEEGQIIPTVDSLRFEYYIKDHLGNVRLVFDENGDILQENDYYTFGLSIARTGTDAVNRYQYNGKEKQPETGYLDYGARMYMPEVGRWGVADPYAERYTSWSPYSFVFNNPLVFIDPDGRDPIYAKNFWGRTKLIGDNGKDDGQSYLVSGAVKKDVKSSTKAGGNYTGSLTESDNVFKIPTGGVMDDVISSVNDTKTSEKEHGGHANFGDANATRWDEGTPAQEVKDASGNIIGAKASMNAFMVNGQSQMPSDASNVEY